MSELACSWCGTPVEPDGGYRVAEPAGERRAVFCRLEHIVPWVIQGADWSPGTEPGPQHNGLGRCAWCAQPVDERVVLLVRHRGAHRIGDAFCSTDHLLEWSKAGGRWRSVS
jgi:hypothetical protein